jgi:osmotically-inducible protein OsmY
MRKHITAVTLALATLGFASAVPAAWDHRNDYNGTLMTPSDAFHSGGASASDDDLAARVATALSQDSVMYGATVTVVANQGRISLSGSAKNEQQAARAESIAREIAGPASVSGTLDAQGG